MSKPTTLAPPSMIAVSTWPISRVQVTLGVPSNGGVRKVSSSSATTTAGEVSRRVRIAEDAPAQLGEDVDGEAAQRIERRCDGNEGRGEGDHEGCECSAQPGSVHERAAGAQPGGKRSSRLTTGVFPVLALASTLKMSVRLPSVAV